MSEQRTGTATGNEPFEENFGSPISSNDTRDSFDWIGDDRKENESDFETDFLEEIEQEGLQTSPLPSTSSSQSWNPLSIVHIVLLLIFIACIGLVALHLVSTTLISILYIPIHLWALLLLISIFVPIWSYNGIHSLTRRLGTTALLSKSEFPAKLDFVKIPLSFLLTSIIISCTWLMIFPKACPSSEVDFFDITEVTEEDCYLQYIPRMLFFLISAGIFFTLNSLMMSNLRSSFQERSFKNRLIKNRFGIHVINELLNVARETRRSQRLGDLGTPRSHEATDIRTATDLIYNLPFVIGKQFAKLFRNPWRTRPESRVYSLVTQNAETAELRDPESIEEEFGQFRREILQTIRTSGYETVASATPRSDHEAKIVAKRIFKYLCPSNRKFLTLQDFSEIINSEAACKDAFELFDADKDGSVTRGEFRGAIVKTFREQRNLAKSFANTGSALSILDSVSASFISLGLFLLLLSLLGIQLQNILGIILSIVLGLNFIVFDAANKTFHALVFLFVVHPFDIGDQIVFGHEDASKHDNLLTVLHIHIQYTVFRRWNGLEVIIPNHVLAGNAISNLSRATEQWEKFEIALPLPENEDSVDTQAEKLAIFRKHIETFLASYPNDYYKAFELKVIISADGARAETDLNCWRFSLKLRCKETLDSQKKWTRHSRVLAFIQRSAQMSGISIVQ